LEEKELQRKAVSVRVGMHAEDKKFQEFMKDGKHNTKTVKNFYPSDRCRNADPKKNKS
jgi:hypothetical protein